ncbi:MAG: hypothetical protein Kow0042_02150 [Calditrichia bacterium]
MNLQNREEQLRYGKKDLKRGTMKKNLDVLVIDDNLEQASITKLLIEQNGFAAQFTTSSQDALKRIQENRPRLVILDLMMPDIDGLRLCKMIKEDPKTSHTRIIIYSGKMYEADRRKALALGADLFLTKPTRSYILVDAIKNLLLTIPDEVHKN